MSARDTRPLVLQLCPFSPYLEEGLRKRFRVQGWHVMEDPARAPWLALEGAGVVGVATNGQIGCPRTLMDALPGLRVIAINGVGVDQVDLEAARSRDIAVGTTPGALTEDVADLAVGLVIALLRGIPSADSHVRSGAWLKGDPALASKVSGRRFGIVGLGQIGLATAQRLAPFGSVAWTGPRRKDVPYAFHERLVDLAAAVDVLVLTLPATPATRRLVDASVLDALGPQGWLVNVARGAVVDEAELIAALQAGRIAGAALDVFEDEPRVPEALRLHPRVVLTPHIASATVETRRAMADRVIANLESALGGSYHHAGPAGS